jgi:sugar phosphate isomerase/epimerase
MSSLRDRLHVKVYLFRLEGEGLDRFLASGFNPEICLDALDLDGTDAAAFSRVAEALAAHGRSCTVHAPFLDLAPWSLDPAVRALTRQRLEQTLTVAAILRPRTVVCHAGFEARRHVYFLEQWLERSAEVWAWFAARVYEAGARLMLENVYERGPEVLRSLLDRLDPRQAGFCLDVGHQALYSRVPVGEWVDALGDRLGQVHLHDNEGMLDDHLALGQGSIDFTALFAELARASEPLAATLEMDYETSAPQSVSFVERRWPWRGTGGPP